MNKPPDDNEKILDTKPVDQRAAAEYRRRHVFAAVFLSALCFGGGLFPAPSWSGTDAVMTGQMARPLLAYRCPTGFASAEDVCRAFQKALGDAAPGHALRRVAKGEAAPELREGDLFLELHANRAGDHGLTGHVEWRRAGDEGTTAGPVLRIDVMDAAPGPSTYDHFVQDLIRHEVVPLTGTARHAD